MRWHSSPTTTKTGDTPARFLQTCSATHTKKSTRHHIIYCNISAWLSFDAP